MGQEAGIELPNADPMVSVEISCPHCHNSAPVVKHGVTDSGAPRCRCKACNKTFAVNPKSKAVTAEKEELVLRCLNERTSIRGICRSAKVEPNTVYSILKKSRRCRDLTKVSFRREKATRSRPMRQATFKFEILCGCQVY